MRPEEPLDPSLAKYLNRWSLVYLTVTLSGLSLYMFALWAWRQRRFRLPEDGLFALASWPQSLRVVLPYFILVSTLYPAARIMIVQMSALLLTVAEDWSHHEAYAYQVGNLMHIETSNLHPATGMGKGIDLFMAALAMLLSASFVGLSISLGMMGKLGNLFPPTIIGFLAAIIDCFLLLWFLCLYDSFILWLIEGHDFIDVFLYMSGMITGMHDQLTSYSPHTWGGMFWCKICLASELALVGTALAIIGLHPVMLTVAKILEGKHLDGSFDFNFRMDVMEDRQRKKDDAEREAIEAAVNKAIAEMNGEGCPVCRDCKIKIMELEYKLHLNQSLHDIGDEERRKDPAPRPSRQNLVGGPNRQISRHADASQPHANQDSSPTELDPRFSLGKTMCTIVGREEALGSTKKKKVKKNQDREVKRGS